MGDVIGPVEVNDHRFFVLFVLIFLALACLLVLVTWRISLLTEQLNSLPLCRRL